jgi:hypothetical protein
MYGAYQASMNMMQPREWRNVTKKDPVSSCCFVSSKDGLPHANFTEDGRHGRESTLADLPNDRMRISQRTGITEERVHLLIGRVCSFWPRRRERTSAAGSLLRVREHRRRGCGRCSGRCEERRTQGAWGTSRHRVSRRQSHGRGGIKGRGGFILREETSRGRRRSRVGDGRRGEYSGRVGMAGGEVWPLNWREGRARRGQLFATGY